MSQKNPPYDLPTNRSAANLASGGKGGKSDVTLTPGAKGGRSAVTLASGGKGGKSAVPLTSDVKDKGARSAVTLVSGGKGGRRSFATSERGSGGGGRGGRGFSETLSQSDENGRKGISEQNLFARLYGHHAVKQKRNIERRAQSVATIDSGALARAFDSALSLDAFTGHLYGIVYLSRNSR